MNRKWKETISFEEVKVKLKAPESGFVNEAFQRQSADSKCFDASVHSVLDYFADYIYLVYLL